MFLPSADPRLPQGGLADPGLTGDQEAEGLSRTSSRKATIMASSAPRPTTRSVEATSARSCESPHRATERPPTGRWLESSADLCRCSRSVRTCRRFVVPRTRQVCLGVLGSDTGSGGEGFSSREIK